MSIVIRSVGQMAAYLPYSLGFYPHRSIVISGQMGKELGMTARQDIPPPEHVDEQARHVVSVFARQGHDAVLLFGVTDGPDPEPFLRSARQRFCALGIGVSHTVLLDGRGRWRVLQCTCGGCPRTWAPLPDLSRNPAVAAAVLRGVAPMDSRADVEALLTPSDPALVDEVAGLMCDPPELDSHQVGTAVRHLVHEDFARVEPSAADLAVATIAMQDIELRDVVLGWVLPHEFPSPLGGPTPRGLSAGLGPSPDLEGGLAGLGGHETEAVERRLAQWARSIPRELRPPVLAVLGTVAWLGGGGALGRTAVEQALDIDSGHRLAQMVCQAFDAGVRPTPREDCRPA